MIPRRQVLTGGLAGGVFGAAGGGEAQAADAAQRMNERAVESIVRAIDDLRNELHSPRQFPEIRAIRDAQLTFFRSNAKFPDYIEVGSDLWLAAYDWHVRWQQPLTLGRDPANRYTLALLATTVILRPDVVPNYIGLPYDSR